MNKRQIIENIITNTDITTSQKVDTIFELFSPKKFPKKIKKEIDKPYINKLSLLKTVINKGVLPILKTICINKEGFAYSTNLEQTVAVKLDKPEGLYEIVGQEIVKTDFSLDEYPLLPHVIKSVTLDIELDKKIINNLIDCACKRPDRISLQGINLQLRNGILYICSTDGKRLFYSKIHSSEKDINIIIPLKVFQILQKSNIENFLLTLKIDHKNDKVLIKHTDFQIISNLIVGDFPDYWQVIPADAKDIYEFQREELLSVLEEIKPFTTKEKRGIEICNNRIEINYVENNRVKSVPIQIIHTHYKDPVRMDNFNGHIIMPMRREIYSKDQIISLNFNYIYDIIKNTDDMSVMMFYNGRDKAIVIQTV